MLWQPWMTQIPLIIKNKRKLFLLTCENYKISSLGVHKQSFTRTRPWKSHDLQRGQNQPPGSKNQGLTIPGPVLQCLEQEWSTSKEICWIPRKCGQIITKKSQWMKTKELEFFIMWNSLKFWNKSRFVKSIATDKEIINNSLMPLWNKLYYTSLQLWGN